MSQENQPTAVFAGGGHVHLYSLKNTSEFIKAGARVVLIGPDRYHYYSGMGPGMLSRIYHPTQVRFDVKTMVESRGGQFVKGRVASVHPEEKLLLLDTGERIVYDLASFNVGSHIPIDSIPGAANAAYRIKPIENLELLRSEILKKIKDGTPQILIIGAGPAGVELAGNVWRLVKEHNGNARITLASSREGVLPRFPSRVRALAESSLTKRGICIMRDFRAASMTKGSVVSTSDRILSFDIAILSTGIIPNGIFHNSGLATAEDGSLLVNDYLQSLTHPDIFGGGDCITLEGKKLDHVGVYAVRQAPILFHNLMARLKKTPLVSFRPQHRYLLIFNLGDGTGLFVRRPLFFRGKWAFLLKDHLDRQFMRRFQVSGETRMSKEG